MSDNWDSLPNRSSYPVLSPRYVGSRQYSAPERQYAVIGIDFGTTFSGVSWAWSHSPNNIDQITSWKGSGRQCDSDKVPSKIIYDSLGRVRGWGFETPTDDQVQVQWFKLLLSDEAKEKGGKQVMETKAKLEKVIKKEPIDVVADFLRMLWKHTMEQLDLKLNTATVDNIELRVVLTVPANWDHKAQERTRKAAEKAGITTKRAGSRTGDPTLRLVTEPEAAALAAWTQAGLQWRPDLKIGDSFTVCDAGGGTVDLISYTVQSLNPLKLEMCVIPTAGLCGAIYLDQAFEAAIRTRVGSTEYDRLSERSRLKFLEGDWEHGIKRAYNGSSEVWPVDIIGYKPKRPGLFGKKPSSTIVLSNDHVASIFDPICSDIVALVKTQVAEIEQVKGQKAKAILLVGGFGENDFLLRRLQDSFHGIPIQRPTKAWTAISRGAVTKGKSNSIDEEVVTNCIARYSYGVMYNERFEDHKHLREDRYWCPYENKYKAKNQMRWYLKKGTNVKKSDSVIHDWYRLLNYPHEIPNIQETIYFCGLDTPPSRRNKDVTKICSFLTNFDPSIFDSLTEKGKSHGNTKVYRELQYSLRMEIAAEEATFCILWQGEPRGKGQIAIEHE